MSIQALYCLMFHNIIWYPLILQKIMYIMSKIYKNIRKIIKKVTHINISQLKT